VKVLVVDDDANVRSALRLLLSSQMGIEAIEEAASAEDMVRVAALQRPAVVLLDLDLPRLRPGLVDEVRARSPGVRIIGMSSRSEPRQPAPAEVDAVIDKMYGPAELRAALAATDGSQAP